MGLNILRTTKLIFFDKQLKNMDFFEGQKMYNLRTGKILQCQIVS